MNARRLQLICQPAFVEGMGWKAAGVGGGGGGRGGSVAEMKFPSPGDPELQNSFFCPWNWSRRYIALHMDLYI